MPITRPSNYLKNKINVQPLVDRLKQVSKEDFDEISTILEEMAQVLDVLYNEQYQENSLGFFSSVTAVAAAYPTPPEGSFVTLMQNNQPIGVATFSNGSWEEKENSGSIVYRDNKTQFPNTGTANVWYIATIPKKIYLWYNNDYQPYGTPGQNGKSSFQLAVQYGYQGNEEQFAQQLTADGLKVSPQFFSEEEQIQLQENLGMKAIDIPNWRATVLNGLNRE